MRHLSLSLTLSFSLSPLSLSFLALLSQHFTSPSLSVRKQQAALHLFLDMLTFLPRVHVASSSEVSIFQFFATSPMQNEFGDNAAVKQQKSSSKAAVQSVFFTAIVIHTRAQAHTRTGKHHTLET